MEPDQGQINRITAMLAKANSPGATTEEAETYLAKAYQLMAKYGIDQALLNESKPGSDAPINKYITIRGKFVVQQARLINGLAKALRCDLVRVNAKEKGTNLLHVFGFESDIVRLELLFASLTLQMFHEVSRTRSPIGENTTTYRHAWMLGFINRVAARVQEAEQRAQNEAVPTVGGRSVALVLADRTAVVKQNIRKAYPRIRSGANTTARGSGYGHGTAAGSRADIGTTRLSGRGSRALG